MLWTALVTASQIAARAAEHPLVGIITYVLYQFIWENDEQADRVAPSRHIDARQE